MELDKKEKLSALREECLRCRECPLAGGRTNVVFGVGDPESELMFIGEGPGENEDLQGEPFVGRAGQFLDLMLELIGIDRKKDIYICNVIKCRPPQNRDPNTDEKAACRPFLDRQIALIKPELIVILGRVAATELLDPQFKITQQHGQWTEYNGIRCIVTYHPSALLRDESKRPEAFDDFRKIRSEIQSRSLI